MIFNERNSVYKTFFRQMLKSASGTEGARKTLNSKLIRFKSKIFIVIAKLNVRELTR
jgi:hypothetical protein